MSDPVLFLDVDGVLNGHADYAPGCALIRPACAAQLQRVIDDTSCAIVVSSAWRYQVLLGAMTLKGFEHLLRSHGIVARIIDTTGRDPADTQQEFNGHTGQGERVTQIRAWLAAHPEVERWAVVDDAKLSLADPSLPIVETDGAVGLTERDARRLVSLLRGGCGRFGPDYARCATCGRSKAPRGRSVADAMAGGMCDDECPGYYAEPRPSSLWPGEACEPPFCSGRGK